MGVEWYIVVVLKQLGLGPDLLQCHVTLTLEILMDWTVTLVGVGGSGVVHAVVITAVQKVTLQMPTSCW